MIALVQSSWLKSKPQKSEKIRGIKIKKLLRERGVTRSLRTRVSEMKNWPYAQVNSEAKNLFLHEKRHPSLSSLIRLRSTVTIYLTAEEDRDDKANFSCAIYKQSLTIYIFPRNKKYSYMFD